MRLDSFIHTFDNFLFLLFPFASIGPAPAVPGTSVSPSPPFSVTAPPSSSSLAPAPPSSPALVPASPPLAPAPPCPPSLVPAPSSHPSAAPAAPPTIYPHPLESSQLPSTLYVSSSQLAAAPGPPQAFSPVAPCGPAEVITTSLKGLDFTFLIAFICLFVYINQCIQIPLPFLNCLRFCPDCFFPTLTKE